MFYQTSLKYEFKNGTQGLRTHGVRPVSRRTELDRDARESHCGHEDSEPAGPRERTQAGMCVGCALSTQEHSLNIDRTRLDRRSHARERSAAPGHSLPRSARPPESTLAD
jgi:hypothetical protein